MHRQIARRSLAVLARLLPLNSRVVYRALRWLYRRIPLPLERKMPWAQHLLADVPQLQQVAYRVAGANGLHASLGSYMNNLQLEGPLLPAGRRILVVEHRLPTPDRNSSSVRLYALLKLLRELDWQVTFVSNSAREDYRWVLSDIQGELPKYEKALADLGIPFLYGMDALIEHVKSYGRHYGVALLSFPEIMHQFAPLVRAFMPGAKLLYDTVDLHGLRFAREAAAKSSDTSLLQKADLYSRMEWSNAESADTVIAVSNPERDEICRHVPSASIEIIPNIHTVASAPPTLRGRDGLLFIGHFLHTPNEDAVLYFLNDIFPLVRERLRNVPFRILGSSMTTSITRYKSRLVQPVGYVEDVAPWFARARVFVAPLRYGAGMKGKIGQSLGLGLPVVTTSVGAEGMQLDNGKNVLIADTPRAFADAVIRLYEDAALWRTLAENGKAHIAAHFSEAAARGTLQRLLQPTAQTSPESQ